MRKLTLLALSLAACTESAGGSVSVTGTIGGKPVVAKSVASMIQTKGSDSFVLVYLSPFADACSATSITTAGGTAIELALFKVTADKTVVPATDPGTYTTQTPSPGPLFAEIDTYSRDASCLAASGEGKGDGTVTLTHVEPGHYAGTFDFTDNGNTERVTGSFETGSCTWSAEPATTCQ